MGVGKKNGHARVGEEERRGTYNAVGEEERRGTYNVQLHDNVNIIEVIILNSQ